MQMMSGLPAARMGNEHTLHVPYNAYPTADDYLFVAAFLDNHWAALSSTLRRITLPDSEARIAVPRRAPTSMPSWGRPRRRPKLDVSLPLTGHANFSLDARRASRCAVFRAAARLDGLALAARAGPVALPLRETTRGDFDPPAGIQIFAPARRCLGSLMRLTLARTWCGTP